MAFRACCTRSTPARSPTRTETGTAICRALIDRLDHLAWLGVDAMWLNPIQPSPNADWGYDVADFVSVHEDFGDLATVDRLLAGAAERGIRVMLDLVPNHTSDRHPWFVEARSDRASPDRDRYVWADARQDGSPPNNWRSTFGGPAWTWDASSEQFYLHNFLSEQPDLNWWSEAVRSDFDAILRFWMDRGVAGFRIDVANGLVKDRELRDNPLDDGRRSRAGAAAGTAARPQHEPTRGPRRVAALASDRRGAGAARRAPGGDVGARPLVHGGLLRIGIG